MFLGACSTSRGIGLEMVRQLSASPSNITIATCRNPAGASDLKVVKENAKGVVHIVPLDVTSETSIRESVKLVSEILGDKGLNYLYNNAGIVSPQSNGDLYLARLINRILYETFHRTKETTLPSGLIGVDLSVRCFQMWQDQQHLHRCTFPILKRASARLS